MIIARAAVTVFSAAYRTAALADKASRPLVFVFFIEERFFHLSDAKGTGR